MAPQKSTSKNKRKRKENVVKSCDLTVSDTDVEVTIDTLPPTTEAISKSSTEVFQFSEAELMAAGLSTACRATFMRSSPVTCAFLDNHRESLDSSLAETLEIISHFSFSVHSTAAEVFF